MPVQAPSTATVLLLNSSTAPLGANATFTGKFENIEAFSFLNITVYSDVASATDGLRFQWSGDGVNVDADESTTVDAATGRAFSLTTRSRACRVTYTNGAAPQSAFRLTVSGHTSGTGLITRPLDKNLTDENFAQTVRAVLSIKQANGSYTNVSSTNGAVPTAEQNILVPKIYDYVSLGYTGTDLTTVTYKTGGSGGTTVATLTLAYSSGILQTVTRT